MERTCARGLTNVRSRVAGRARIRGVIVCLWLSLSSFGDPAGAAPAPRETTPSAAGIVRGFVKSAEDGTPLAGATVSVAGEGLAARTDENGEFRLEAVPAGSRILEVVRDGYLGQKVPVEIAPGAIIDSAILLPVADALQTIIVTGRLLRASERRQLLDRRFAAQVSDRSGAEEIKQTPASDAGAVAARLPAVSIVGGRYAYVRGLGERYSQTLVDGAMVPSPEPGTRAVPLDLFQAQIIESLVIAKTYSPDLPGEFAGGSVQVETIGVPREPFLSIGASTKARVGTTFGKFHTYDGGALDAFTFEDGTRELPGLVPRERVRPGALTEEQLQLIGRDFENTWNVRTRTAPPDHKLSLALGDRYRLGDEGALGVIAAGQWGNSYRIVQDETFNMVKNGGTMAAPDNFVQNSYTLETSTFEAELSGLLGVTWELNPAQRIGIRTILSRTNEDRVRVQKGYDGYQGRNVRTTDFRYVERILWHNQLEGEHLLVGDTVLGWRASYARCGRYEPDHRSLRYDLYEGTGRYELEDVPKSGARDFYYMDEDILDAGIDYAIPFNPFGIPDPNPNPESVRPEQKIQIGAAGMFRSRDFDSRLFRFIPDSGTPLDEDGSPIDITAPPEDIFQPPNINPDGYEINEETRGSDQYQAAHTLIAGYAMTDFRILSSLRAQIGVRFESSDQDVTTYELFGNPAPKVKAQVKEGDWMPAANLTWGFADDMQIRAGASRTVSRPEFRELAKFQYRDIAGGFAARGNPSLDRATITSGDLRWEWFPSPGDLVSVSAFGKTFEDPIEKVIVPTGSDPITTWENAESAYVYGTEIEVRKGFGFIGEPLRNLSLKTNFAWIRSEVKVNEGAEFAQTNDKRPLQGQPEYTLNAGLFYDSAESGWSGGILASTFGKRINAVGSFGVPDEEEDPRWNLDVVVGKKIGAMTIRASAENILNEAYHFRQGSLTSRKYKVGMTVGLSVSYTF
ncbi:MAG: TonB-dependent receptor [Planctomycetes bacterium]|nr:TonB-dependent receptor [Planctomycetota bacterium]